LADDVGHIVKAVSDCAKTYAANNRIDSPRKEQSDGDSG